MIIFYCFDVLLLFKMLLLLFRILAGPWFLSEESAISLCANIAQTEIAHNLIDCTCSGGPVSNTLCRLNDAFMQ